MPEFQVTVSDHDATNTFPRACTRREFLRNAGAISLGIRPLMSGLFMPSVKELPVTGYGQPGLKVLDDLMNSFLQEHRLPGAALAVTRKRKLVYSRGFGFADLQSREPVLPSSLFRIASVSKPLTAAAALKLAELGKIGLHDRALDYIKKQPYLASASAADERWNQITVLHLLQHRGGWDRSISTDPVIIPWEIARVLGISPPIRPEHIVRYMLGRPIDFDPGHRFAYSNFGYLLLGRIIEAVTSQSYEAYLRKEILSPLGIQKMTLGRALQENRFKNEVVYYDAGQRKGPSLYGPEVGREVPLPYGADNFESYDAHGGWIASAADLVRFLSCFDEPSACPVLSNESIKIMCARPEGEAGHNEDGTPRSLYYGCGWMIQPTGAGSMVNMWHSGLIAGTSSSLFHRWDTINWAVLFNSDSTSDGQAPYALIDQRIREALKKILSWPGDDLFEKA